MVESDQHIIEQVRAGDSRRYALLVDRYKDRGMTLAVRLLENREEAEELLQDAFLRAFKSLDQFRGEAKFSTWFYRILYNLCMTRVTRRKKRRIDRLDGDNEHVLDSALVDTSESSAQERLEDVELQQIILVEIGRLPESLKTAVTLFYVQEMSYEDIAATLDLPLGTVKTNLFRGRNLLRQRVLGRIHDEVSA